MIYLMFDATFLPTGLFDEFIACLPRELIFTLSETPFFTQVIQKDGDKKGTVEQC